MNNEVDNESPTGIEPMASQIPVGRSNQLSYERFVVSWTIFTCTCHINLRNGAVHNESLVAQLVTVPNRYLGGHGFDSRRGLRICFFVPCSCHVEHFNFIIKFVLHQISALRLTHVLRTFSKFGLFQPRRFIKKRFLYKKECTVLKTNASGVSIFELRSDFCSSFTIDLLNHSILTIRHQLFPP